MESLDGRPKIPWSCQDHTDFVKAFERYPALWDTRSNYFNDPIMVDKAYEALLGKFPLYFITKQDVQRKVIDIRNMYTNDLKDALTERFSPNKRKRPEWLGIADRFFKHWINVVITQNEIKIEQKDTEIALANGHQFDLLHYNDDTNSSHAGGGSISAGDDEYNNITNNDRSLISNSDPRLNQEVNCLQLDNANNLGLDVNCSNTNDSSVYNQTIKIEPDFVQVPYSASLPSPPQVVPHLPPPSCSSYPRSKRKRKADCSESSDVSFLPSSLPSSSTPSQAESSLSIVLEKILSEGFRSLSKQSSSSDVSEAERTITDKAKHPDHYFYEFIKDLTASWPSEKRRKLRNRFNQVLEDIEKEIETEGRPGGSST